MDIQEKFLNDVASIFPALKPKLDDESDFFHIQLSIFENRVTEAIRKRDEKRVRHSFLLINKFYLLGDDELKSTIDTGFVEGVLSLLEHDDKAWEFSLMPKQLKSLYEGFWGAQS